MNLEQLVALEKRAREESASVLEIALRNDAVISTGDAKPTIDGVPAIARETRPASESTRARPGRAPVPQQPLSRDDSATPVSAGSGGSGLRVLGWFMLIGGVAWLVVAFNMDTTVDAPFVGRVHNVGLVNSQQLQVYVGGLLALLGGIFIAVGGRSVASAAPPGNSP